MIPRRNTHPIPALSAWAPYVVGMAMFFSTSITQVMMPLRFFSESPSAADGVASLVLLLAIATFGLGYLLLRSYRVITRQREAYCLLACLLVTVALQTILLASPSGSDAATALRWMYLLALAATLVCLTTVWAGACDFFDGRDLRILIPLAMLLSIGFGVGARILGQAMQLPPGTVQLFLPVGSGLVGIWLLRHLSKSSREGGTSGEPEYGEFHPTGEVRGSRSLLAGWAVMWVFLLGTSLFVGYYSHGLRLDALGGGGHVLTVFILALGMIAIARLAEKHLLRFQVSIILFVGLCLIALYCTAMFGASLTTVAKNILLPARACAIFFSWLVLEEYCRERNISFASMASVTFFPLVILVKMTTVASWPLMNSAIAAGHERTILMAACLTTAFLVTAGAFFIARYGWGSDSSREHAAALSKRAFEEGRKGAEGRKAAATLEAVGEGPSSAAWQDSEAHEQAADAACVGEADDAAALVQELHGEADGSGADADESDNLSRDLEHASDAVLEKRALELMKIRYGLTNREFDVLTLTMRGHTQKGMANELYLSVNSISTYVKALHAKLEVHSRQEIIDLVCKVKSEL